MKRIFKNLIFVTLILATLLGAVSCGGEMEKYSENGLSFALPKDMKKMNVNYADLCFGNDELTEVIFYFISKDSLLTMCSLDKEATVKEYADWFCGSNGYTNVEENYDEENQVIILKYIYEDEDEHDYYCDYITRNEHAVFHVTMCCKANLKDKYDPMFDEWMTYIHIN